MYSKKEDQLASQRRHYKNHKADYIQRQYDRRARFYVIIYEAKNRPCGDCRHEFPLICMDFDHILGEKKFDIADVHLIPSEKALREELLKCEVVCSNCHRIRTSKRLLPDSATGSTALSESVSLGSNPSQAANYDPAWSIPRSLRRGEYVGTKVSMLWSDSEEAACGRWHRQVRMRVALAVTCAASWVRSCL